MAKYRNYNITIHKTQLHYNDLQNYLNELKKDYSFNYYYILHEHDIFDNPEELKTLNEEREKNGKPPHKLGDPKSSHYHLILTFENPISEKTPLKLFEKCHIEITKDLCQSIKYLIHTGFNDKYQYKKEEIKTDNPLTLEEMLQNIKPFFDNQKILEDIEQKGFRSITDFYRQYGIIIKPYLQLIKTLLNDLSVDESKRMKDVEIIETLQFEIERLRLQIKIKDDAIKELKGYLE